MAAASSSTSWLRMLLFLAPPMMFALLLALGEYPVVVGAAVHCILVEMCTPFLRRLEARPVVCALPLVAAGGARSPTHPVFLAFAAGYFGAALETPQSANLFMLLCTLLVFDLVLFYSLDCFPMILLLATAAVSLAAGALFRYALLLQSRRRRGQSGCTKK